MNLKFYLFKFRLRTEITDYYYFFLFFVNSYTKNRFYIHPTYKSNTIFYMHIRYVIVIKINSKFPWFNSPFQKLTKKKRARIRRAIIIETTCTPDCSWTRWLDPAFKGARSALNVRDVTLSFFSATLQADYRRKELPDWSPWNLAHRFDRLFFLPSYNVATPSPGF